MWLFGYGSLVWKVDFPVERKVIGFIKGYVRRFYQASPDHRGAPGKPGRVVTLLPSSEPNDIVWGVAYLIAEKDVENVLKHLDYREKAGYDMSEVLFYPKETPDKPFILNVYIANTQNVWFLGEAEIEVIAKQIAEAEGWSGPNFEYLYRLAAAMREFAPDHNDCHLFDLEAAVRKIISNKTLSSS